MSEKASPIIFIYFSFSTAYIGVFLLFTPNPVKLFLRDNQCSHTSLLQLINETPLILLLSAFFICLVCLVCLILACPLLFFSPLNLFRLFQVGLTIALQTMAKTASTPPDGRLELCSRTVILSESQRSTQDEASTRV